MESQHNLTGQKQKRARSQLSCNTCRVGKLKCSRTRPACDQCEKRGKASLCSYPPPATRSRKDQNVKGRIRHLEQLVQQLAANAQAPGSPSVRNHGGNVPTSDSNDSIERVNADSQFTPPESEGDSIASRGSVNLPSPEDQPAVGFGHLNISRGETSYVGTAHWASILEGISELKRELDGAEDGTDLDEQQGGDGDVEPADIDDVSTIGSLLRSPKRLTRAEILQSLPSRSEVDDLVSTWFCSHDPFKQVIHKDEFEELYRNFWQNPHATPTMWLGQLFVIMSLGCFVRLQKSRDYSSQNAFNARTQADHYFELSAAAIALADYTRPKKDVISTLILYTSGARLRHMALDVWLLLGVVIRLAISIGIHRDGCHYANLTPFECEMRRRIYSILYMSDALTSFHLGLPAMLRAVQSDTKHPHNLLDRDFGPRSTVLPPERPVNEFTPIAYTNAKVRICKVFSDAAELSHSAIPPSYEDVMVVDARLEEARNQIPPTLRAKAYEIGVTDNPDMILCCINLDILYLKTKCVLHRGFMTNTPSRSAQAYSHTECLKSAVQILRHHQTMTAASKPGGRLQHSAWHIESFAKSDYLMSAMIICMELNQQSKANGPDTDHTTDMVASRDDMIKTLEGTKAIWSEAIAEKSRSFHCQASANAHGETAILKETIKACKAMDAMLRLVRIRTEQPRTGQGEFSQVKACGEHITDVCFRCWRSNTEFGTLRNVRIDVLLDKRSGLPERLGISE